MSVYDKIRDILEESSYTVAMCGTDMMKESGMPGMRSPEMSFKVEQEYGYSPEEIYTSVFLTNRPHIFFKYYRDYMLKPPLEPSDGFKALAELEKRGKLQCSIENNMHNLIRRGGCEKVISLHGSMDNNICPRCGRKYSMEFVRDQERVPLCEDCLVPVRPQVRLFGEQVDNTLMTRAADEITKAEVLLILGSSLNSGLCEEYVQYYQGSNMIIIHSQEHYLDDRADMVLIEEVKEAMPKIVWPEGRPA